MKERVLSHAWCWLVASGLMPSSWPGSPRIGAVALELRGRRGGKAVLRRGKPRRVTLEELRVEERAPVLKAWLGRTGVSSIPRKYL